MIFPSPRSCFARFLLLLSLIAPLCNANAQNVEPAARIVQAVDNKQFVTLKGNINPFARAEFDQGVVPDNQPLKRMLLLLQRGADQEAALRQLLDDQQSKASPKFQQWLTPEQFGAQFGVADSDLREITQWLGSQGFSDIHIGSGRTVIEFSGNAGQLRNAFHTQLHRFRVATEDHFANSSDLQIPAALAPVVAGVVSLNNFPRRSHLHKVGVFSRSKNTGKITPEFTAFGCGNNPCFAVGPADFAVIYNTAPLLNAIPKIDGTGQTIAIVGESDIDVQDIADFRAMFGLPANFSDENIIVNGIDPGFNSSEGESDLDVEWAGAVAPGAKVLFVTSSPTETTAGIDLSALYIVDHNLAGVMSTSFGTCEQNLGTTQNQFYNALWQQAAAQGITSLVSSGDGGSAGCDNFNTQSTATKGLAVSGMASTPFNIAVGGTDFDQDNRTSTFWNPNFTPATPLPVPASALSYIPEVPWNDSCAQVSASSCASAGNNSNIVAGSGGSSTLYPKPFWQMGIPGMPSDTHRQLPDVSLFAGNGFHDSFYIMCQRDESPVPTCNLSDFQTTFLGVGGTSVSSPALAGIMALVNQKTGARQGNANVTFYALSKQAGSSCAADGASLPAATCTFNDVAKSNNSVPCTGKSPNCSSTVTTTVGVLVDPSDSTPAYKAVAGYDRATGLGSVNAANLINNWLNVSTQGTTTSLTINGGSLGGLAHGSSVPVSITVSPTTGSGTPSGDVALIATLPDGTTYGLGEFTLGEAGTVSASTKSLLGGSYKLSARYTGDGTFAPSSFAQQNLNVSPENAKVLISLPTFNPQTGRETGNAPATLSYGSFYIARMDVGNSSIALTYPPTHSCIPTACPTGSVTLSDSFNGATAVPLDGGLFPLNSFGFTEDFAINLTGGQHVLTANYSGDSSFNFATGTYSVNVTPASTWLIPSNPPFPSTVSTPFFLSTILTMDVYGAMPACNFTFTDGATVLPGTPTCQWQANGPFLYVSFSVAQATAGAHTYSAKFNGDSNYSSSSAVSLPTRVYYGTSATLTTPSTTLQLGDTITLTAVIDSGVSQGPAITPAVNFTYENVPLADPVTYTPFTDNSGNLALRATVTTRTQTSGFYNAIFPGDSTYSQSGALINVTINIPDFSVSSTQNSVTATAGQPGTANISVTPASNSASPVTLNCADGYLPLNVTCSFSPGTVNLSNGNVGTSILTFNSLPPSDSNTISSAPPEFRLPAPNFPPLPRNRTVVLLTILVVAFLSACARSARGARLQSAAFFGCSFALFLFFLGCGGGSTGTSGGGGSGGGGGNTEPVASSITLTTDNVKVAYPGIVTLTAHVTSTRTPGGTVAFHIDGGGTIINLVGGVAQLQLPLGQFGTHIISASYSGDSNNLPSQTSGNLNVVLPGPGTAIIRGITGNLVHTTQFPFTLQ